MSTAAPAPQQDRKGPKSGSRKQGRKIRRSKRYAAAAEKVGPKRAANVAEASTRVLAGATAKFPETIEIHIRLGIDPSKTDQNVRGTVSLPSGTGKSVRIAVFAQGDAAAAAKAAGAEIVGAADLVETVSKGAVDFDVAIAAPDMMREVGKLGRVLGPKGLMPNPKTGTVTADVAAAVKEFKAGKVEFRSDKGACIHAPLGKSTFTAEQITANADALLAAILRAKPDSAKGVYLRSVTLASTMGPGVRLDTATVRRLAGAV